MQYLPFIPNPLKTAGLYGCMSQLILAFAKMYLPVGKISWRDGCNVAASAGLILPTRRTFAASANFFPASAKTTAAFIKTILPLAREPPEVARMIWASAEIIFPPPKSSWQLEKWFRQLPEPFSTRKNHLDNWKNDFGNCQLLPARVKIILACAKMISATGKIILATPKHCF